MQFSWENVVNKNCLKYIYAYMHVIIEKVINGEQKWSWYVNTSSRSCNIKYKYKNFNIFFKNIVLPDCKL